MRVALVLVFVTLARSAQASENGIDPDAQSNNLSEREGPDESFSSFENGDVAPKTVPESATPNKTLLEKFFESSGVRSIETAKCSGWVDLNLASILFETPRDPDDKREFISRARSYLERCMIETDKKFRESGVYMFEWSLDKFFGTIAVRNGKITDKELFKAASSFDFRPEVFQNEQLCELAVAFNKLRKSDMSEWLRYVTEGMAKISWYSRPRLNSMLDQVLHDTLAANCEAEIKKFFKDTCRANSPELNYAITRVNLAAIFGVDSVRTLGARAAKHRQYRLICDRPANFNPTGAAQMI